MERLLDKVDDSTWRQERLPLEFEGGGTFMAKKALKPPYYRLTATCSKHGTVTVERKPNPRAGQPEPNGSGRLITPHPGSVVCPYCAWHATVYAAELITKDDE